MSGFTMLNPKVQAVVIGCRHRPIILAIDPGTEKSGWALYGGSEVLGSGVLPNATTLACLKGGIRGPEAPDFAAARILAIEMVASYGMAVGREVFETVVWIGRFLQAWRAPDEVLRVYRREVKLHLCETVRATDSNIWHALLDRFGPPGTKAAPGTLYGVKGHARAALALAVTVDDQTP